MSLSYIEPAHSLTKLVKLDLLVHLFLTHKKTHGTVIKLV